MWNLKKVNFIETVGKERKLREISSQDGVRKMLIKVFKVSVKQEK
jgi:uncharacterized protein YnzC (UPF0291/DUF896 family)